MIRRWRVHQFKSIQDPVELTLAPLTVLAGANSSGKSSLIQSILLLSQTCLSKVQARPIVLNGPLLRMGPSLTFALLEQRSRKFPLDSISTRGMIILLLTDIEGLGGVESDSPRCQETYASGRRRRNEQLRRAPVLRMSSLGC
jgi:hypothetical protein